jgi:cellulose 1,4-beta-cellobiosidase
VVIEYEVEISAATTAAIGSQIWIVNNGSSPVNLDDLTVRYYLTNEVSATLTNSLNWANVGVVGGSSAGFPTGNIGITVVPLSPPVASADTYVEFSFTGSNMLPANQYVQFSWRVQDFSSQNFTQTGDYSFSAAATAETSWQNVVLLYQGQSVVWGVPP